MNNEHFSKAAAEHVGQTVSSLVRQKTNKYIGQTIGDDVYQVTDEVDNHNVIQRPVWYTDKGIGEDILN